jgi:hypothetical protein
VTLPQARYTLILIALLGVAGCQHYGPRSITADRMPYNEAIAMSWKEQTLLNIVKLRYADTPFFIDVPQITSGYTLQGGAAATAGIYPPYSNLASFAQQLGTNLSLQGAYQDRPTISYQPQTGSQFIRNLTTPINPGSVMFLVQSGYPADIVFDLTVDSINGIRNQSVTGGQLRPADPEFKFVIQAIRKAQVAGHIGIRVERDPDKKDSVAFLFHDKSADPELARELAEVRKVLRLAPDQSQFRIAFGAVAANPNEIAILSRSVIRILTELAAEVDVPPEHQVSGIAPALGHDPNPSPSQFHVHSGCARPCDPFVAVRYENRWFWIEKNDFMSKRTMGHLLILLALSDTGAKENLPVITIQAN